MTAPPRSARTAEGPTWTRRASSVDAPLLVAAMPPEVPFGFLGRVAPPSEAIRIDLELHPIGHPEAMALLESTEAVARAELLGEPPGPGARTAELGLEADSAADVARAVAGRRQELYRVGLGWRASGASPAAADRGRRRLARRLASLGFRLRVPTFQARTAADPPSLAGGERRPPGYWHTLSTDGAAAFFPFVDESVLEPGGILVGLLLEDASPVVLDRYGHGSHSWGLFGATGSGKTFAAALWALRTRWAVPSLEIYVLDPLGEFGAWAELLGGTVVRAGGSAPLVGNPLAAGDGEGAAPADRAGVLLRALFPSLRDEESAALDGALGRLYAATGAPTFSELRAELLRGPGDPGRLPTLLEVFRTGSLRHLDRPAPAPARPDPVVFDLSGVPEAQRPFHLAYVLSGLVGRLRANDRPKLVVVDEAHLLTRTEGSADYLDRLVRQVRHFRTGLLVLSQSPDDFLTVPAGRSLLRNLRATAILRLPNVSPEVREFFDLTAAEADWLPRARLPKEAGYSEGLLRFGPSHLPLAVVASTAEYEFLRRGLEARPKPAPPPLERHA